jgi:hypothetical protein
VRNDAEDARAQLLLEAVHHRQHHDQRRDAEREPEHRNQRDEGDEAVADQQLGCAPTRCICAPSAPGANADAALVVPAHLNPAAALCPGLNTLISRCSHRRRGALCDSFAIVSASSAKTNSICAPGATSRRRRHLAGRRPSFNHAGTFHAAAVDRWYLQLPAGTELGRFDVLPLSAVAGRSVGRQLPATPETRWLRQMLNEAQMILHQHPANARREDEGRSTINSLWLWGAGKLPTGGAGEFAGLWSDQPLARGLGRAAAIPVQGVPENAAALLARSPPGSRQMLLLDALQSPVQYEDSEAYRATLLDLEARWFAPLQKALAGGRMQRLRLVATTAYGALAWDSDRQAQWQLWRRPQPLAATAQALARGER